MKTWLRRFAIFSIISIALLLIVGVGTIAYIDSPRPEGVADEAADALARDMIASVNPKAWANTGAITWTYGGRYNHLWDRERNFVRVKRGGFEALVDIKKVDGVAYEDGVALTGADKEAAIEKAYASWANDSFWVDAMHKAFDSGTTRSRVKRADGGESLLVAYSSGGVTPGDAYLWHLDENGRPTSWQMWVSIIPAGGVEATWGGWIKLTTGAWISTEHKIGPLTIEVTDVAAATSLKELVGEDDPFAPLLKALGE